jgi:hypothetical protein
MTKNCDQTGCTNPGAFRYTWPGKNEAIICEKDVTRLLTIADAMGLHLQVIPL